MQEEETFVARPITVDTPETPSVAIIQEHIIQVANLNTAPPVLDSSIIDQDHIISTGDMNTGAVSVPDISMSEEETFSTGELVIWSTRCR